MSTSDQHRAAGAPIAAPGAASDRVAEGETKQVRDVRSGTDGEPARSADAGPAAGTGSRSASGSPAADPARPVAEADEAAVTEAVAVADGADVPGTRVTDAGIAGEARPEPAAPGGSGSGERRLTPRQARRLRVALSSVGMAAMAVVLALRIASRSSVLVVGVYGLALILCGIVIELSRNGRTRLGTWLLVVGLAAAIGSDWLLIP